MNVLSSPEAYATRVRMLRKDEECALVQSWNNGNTKAGDEIIEAHMPLVRKVAKRYLNCNLSIEELVSCGNLGLVEALKRFKLNRECRFSTYAMWWIKASIMEFIELSSFVRCNTTSNRKRLFYQLWKVMRENNIFNTTYVSSDQISNFAKLLKVSSRDVIAVLECSAYPMSLDAPVKGKIDDSSGGTLLDSIIDQNESPEDIALAGLQLKSRRELLQEALSTFNERDRYIFEERYLSDEPTSITVLAEKFNISKQRVVQIEKRVFAKVVKMVREKVKL